MLKQHQKFFASWLLVSLIITFSACNTQKQTAKIPLGDIDAFRPILEKHDFTSKFAPFVRVDLIKLYEVGKLADAAGNNANAPYRGLFGSIPESIPLTSVSQIISAQDKIDQWLYTSPGLLQGWQINPDEAIVLITKTPPKCVYFSYCGFIFNKYYQKNLEKKWIWTSFNDPLNHMTIKTTGTPNGAPGDPFDKDSVIIITADKGIDQRIRKALVEAGYPEDIINTYVIPISMVSLGIGPEFDSIVFGQRMALFDNPQLGEKYVNTITAALKVTPIEQSPFDPFSAPKLRVRGNGVTEIDYKPVLDELRLAILSKYSHLEAKELKTSVWLPESYDAIQTELYVAGESRDTSYLRSETLTLGDNPDEFVIVYGVNHAATGKATYANCNFYGEEAWNGVVGIYNTEYAGSAEAFLPGNPLAKFLYVCKFSRTMDSDMVCIKVPDGPLAHGVGLNQSAFIGFRAY